MLYRFVISLSRDWNFLKKIDLHSNCRYFCDPFHIDENTWKGKDGGEARKGRERVAGRKHSARKSLNLHESRPVVTFQCPLAFRSLKYRLISRNGWGASASACKTRVVHQRYELYMTAGKEVSLTTIMQLESRDRQNRCVLTRSDSFSAP